MNQLRVERLGFTPIYQPAGDKPESPKAHTVNIVFVHGLRGNPQSTWEYAISPPPAELPSDEPKPKKRRILSRAFQSLRPSHHGSDVPLAPDPSLATTSTPDEVQKSVYWPADILPDKVPDARIWTYGYNADVISGFFRQNNQNSIFKHANDFMVKLERTLRDDRPIIFITHSLGGLVVKRALYQMESSLDASHHCLISRVSAVVFCGCPHRGADAAAWGNLASKLIAVAFADSTSKLLSDLEIDSEILDVIQDDFLKTLRRTLSNSTFRVHSFLEGRAVTGIKGLNSKVVDNFSSKLGWPEETFETIDADHREMVKEPGVKDISSVLQDLEKQANVSYEWKLPENKRRISYESYKHLHMFFMVDYQAILSQIPKRWPNTCSWILEADALKRWARGEGSSVLWLRGYPGLGKSVIAKYLVEEVLGTDWTSSSVRSPHRNDPIVVFFFCSYSNGQAQSLKTLLSSLLHQLLFQKPELSRGIRKRYETLSQPLTESVWNLWSMLDDVILEIPRVYPTALTPEAAFVPPPKNLYIVVDALDELHKTEWGPFCDRFFEILKRNQNAFRLVITSRKEPDIERQLAAAWCLDLSSTNQNASDVAEYLRTSVSIYGKENNFGDEMIHTITSDLTRGAEGMFLWASLAWSFFTGGVGTWTRAILQQRLQDLQHLPPGMETLYHRILASVDSKNHAELLEALQWIVAAARPLTTDEIAIALALRKRPRKKRYIDIRLNIRAFFKRTCPHLVKVSPYGTITLVHLSFKDYLLETLEINNGTERIPNTFHSDLAGVNFEIGLDCLSYIVLDDFANKPLAVVTREHEFFNYAYHNWLGHLAGRNDRISEIWVYFIRLIDHMTKLLRWYDTSEVIISLWTQGLSRLFEPAVEFGMDLNVVDTRGDHFIHLVVPEVGKFPLESVKFLTGLGLSINGRTQFGQTLLLRCISEWQDEMSNLLCSAEDQIYFDDQDREDNVSPDTGTGEHCSTERTLYDLLSFPGIDPNVMDVFGYTPLSFAIHEGLDRAVAILLACPQLDITKGFAALHVAAKEGVVPAVEGLLSRGVSVSEKTKYGETALHLAASNGHLRVLKLLASKSPIHVLNAKDHNGWTAAHRAVTSGNDELVLWLIQQPNINLDLRDKHGRRATAFAAAYGTETMLKAFLERRPDDITHLDSFGNTLFHMAGTGSNQQNFSFLYSLYKQGLVACPGANKWGKTVVDLAPTPDIEKYLRGLGFAHSERYLSHCDELSILNLRAMAEKTTIPTGSNTSMELSCYSSEDSQNPRPRKRKVSTSPKTDRLGWKFNSIYAID